MYPSWCSRINTRGVHGNLEIAAQQGSRHGDLVRRVIGSARDFDHVIALGRSFERPVQIGPAAIRGRLFGLDLVGVSTVRSERESKRELDARSELQVSSIFRRSSPADGVHVLPSRE